MNAGPDHPSTFELDLWFAEDEQELRLREHVRTCEACGRYIEALRTLAGAAPAMQHAGRSPRSPRGAVLRRIVPFAGGLAAAAAVVLAVRARSGGESHDYVGVKGGASVQLLVKSSGAARVWDGRSSVRPGDALALRVTCAAGDRVTVAARGASGWGRLREEPCVPGADVLPFTLVVDAEGDAEHVAVVITREHVDDPTLASVIEAPNTPAFVQRFSLRKERAP
jgi:hypothetical protein